VEFVMALVYHCFCRSGTLAQHAARLNKIKISDSAFSQRRQNVPFEFFEKLLAMALRPFATEEKQPEAFYRGLRLTAFEGTQFSISNTPQALAGLSKAASRRFQAAFAKIGVCVLVDCRIDPGQCHRGSSARRRCRPGRGRSQPDQLPQDAGAFRLALRRA
jgi:hypothetical protein